jgi:hypothetical protein
MSNGGDGHARQTPGAASGESEGLGAFPLAADALDLFSAESTTGAHDVHGGHGRDAVSTRVHDVADTAGIVTAQALAVRPQAGVPALATQSSSAVATQAASPHRGAHPRKRPVLVSALVAIAVWGIGSLASWWNEREQPRTEPAIVTVADATPAETADLPASSPASPRLPDDGAPALEATPVALTARATAPAAAAPPERAAAPARLATAPVGAAPAAAASARTTRIEAAEPVRAPDAPGRAPATPVPDTASARLEFSEDAAGASMPEPGALAPSPAPTSVAAVEAPAAPAAAVVVPVLPIDRLAADREAINGVLGSYRASYNALDATSVSTIWQGLDTRALQRAFGTLTRQSVVFDRCDVRVSGGDRAEARCRGMLSFVPKIGDGSTQQRRLSWTFEFQRIADRWLIASVSAR